MAIVAATRRLYGTGMDQVDPPAPEPEAPITGTVKPYQDPTPVLTGPEPVSPAAPNPAQRAPTGPSVQARGPLVPATPEAPVAPDPETPITPPAGTAPSRVPPGGDPAAPPAQPAGGAPPAGAPPPGNPEDIGAQTRSVTADELVSAQLDKLLDGNSPLIQRARALAMQSAASRGLQNSSIAAEAGTAAAIDAALPIAGADASTYNRQGLVNQDATNQFRSQDKSYRGARVMAGEDRTWRSGESDKDRSLQEKLTDKELANRTQIAGMQLAASQAEAAARIQLGLAQISSSEKLASASLDQQLKLAGIDDETRRWMHQTGLDAQLQINSASLSNSSMTNYAGIVASIFNGPGEQEDKMNNFRMISAIFNGNPNMPFTVNLNNLPPATPPPPG